MQWCLSQVRESVLRKQLIEYTYRAQTIHILRIELVAFLSLLVKQREFYQLALKTLGYSWNRAMIPTTGFPPGLGKACAHLRWLGQLRANIRTQRAESNEVPQRFCYRGRSEPCHPYSQHTMLSRSVMKLPLKTTLKTSGPQTERALGCCFFWPT